jgi:hypothetical protein
MAKDASWDEPFLNIATKKNKGIFIGMKMYPPLGYKPNDFERMPDLNKVMFSTSSWMKCNYLRMGAGLL